MTSPELVHDLGSQLGFYTVFPFALMLLSIAVLPLIVPHFWEKNRNKGIVALIFAAPVVAFLLWVDRPLSAHHSLVHSMKEYISFIILLGALYAISGGIVLRGSLRGTPVTNTVFMAIGSVIANFLGTTGASMVLLRPVIRANAGRGKQAYIIIFFIFIVSNIGGCLTPLGDPPLFLGFLRGVPFQWTLRLIPQWSMAISVLLVVFFACDSIFFAREKRSGGGPPAASDKERRPLSVAGKRNFIFICGVVASAFFSGLFKLPWGCQEGAMLTMAILSMVFTPSEYHRENDFTFHPIIEVAVLFAAIFVTMVPALKILEVRGASMGLDQPWQFFWVTGVLSSFLDNAPTYLTFSSLASGVCGTDANLLNTLLDTANGAGLLTAVSVGAVFMGANTYIGNGPNFMVKAIAEERGIKMPSFFGYMAYSVLILIPLFIAVTFIFFRA